MSFPAWPTGAWPGVASAAPPTPFVPSPSAPGASSRSGSGPLQPQAALEVAVRDSIRAALGLRADQCDCMFNGQPPPRCGLRFVSVWYDNQRTNRSPVALDEIYGVYVTVTVRITLPFDRWIQHRDDVEALANAIRAVVQRDSYNFLISAAANNKAGFDRPTTPIGFRGALVFDRFDPLQVASGPWFGAKPDAKDQGLTQTIRFGKSRRVQAQLTAV